MKKILILALVFLPGIVYPVVICGEEPPSCATLETDKQVYQQGESVRILFTNDCQTSIYLPNFPSWTIRDKNGKSIFDNLVFPVETEIGPSEEKEWVWNQKDRYGKQVQVGTYRFELYTAEGTYTATFEIIAAPPTCARVTTNKSTYQIGERVEIKFINDCQTPINYIDEPPWQIKDSQGKTVFPYFAFFPIIEVPPGGEKAWTWDQKDGDGNQIPEGRYSIELRTDKGIYMTYFDIFQLSDCAILETDKPAYQIGEPVEIQYTNNCQVTISLPSEPPWAILAHNGDIVYPDVVLHIVVEVPPGEQKKWVWDQKDRNRKQVPTGTYAVELTSVGGASYTTSFDILQPSDCAFLSTDKSAYQMGVPVTILFTNNCQTTINLPSDPPMVISDSNGNVVYPEMVLPVEVEVQPGHQKTWVWDQKSNQKVRKQVPEGTYTIEITSLEGAYYRTTIEIVEAGDCAVLETDKPVYQEGDLVTIKFTNNCQTTITFPSDPPWVISNRDGIVSPAAVEFVLIEIEPGGTKTWTWDQKNKDKIPKQVPAGAYTLELTSVEGVSYKITFEIVELFTPVPSDMVKANQEEYQPGESIEITFTNNSPGTITFPADQPWVIKDSQGRIIFSPSVQNITVEVRPGEKKTWAWDQKDEGGNQVLPGTYIVEFSTTEETTYTTTFDIKEKEGGFDAWFFLIFSSIVIIFWRFRHTS